MMRPLFLLLVVATAAGFHAHAMAQDAATRAAKGAPLFTTHVERCIIPAATHHHVNHYVLRAILKVESGLNPRAIGINRNGTKDVGIGQHNSGHFKELASYGVAPEHLMDECVGTYVAAWHLRKAISRHGNTWFGIAAYHSATPYYNQRYQAMVFNELLKYGVVSGRPLTVPPLHPSRSDGKTPAKAGAGAISLAQSQSPSVVVNE